MQEFKSKMPPLPQTAAYGRSQAEFYSPILSPAYKQDLETTRGQDQVPTLPDIVGHFPFCLATAPILPATEYCTNHFVNYLQSTHLAFLHLNYLWLKRDYIMELWFSVSFYLQLEEAFGVDKLKAEKEFAVSVSCHQNAFFGASDLINSVQALPPVLIEFWGVHESCLTPSCAFLPSSFDIPTNFRFVLSDIAYLVLGQKPQGKRTS